MYYKNKICPNCGKVSLENISTNSIRNFTCNSCGYFEFLLENNKQLDIENDQGRYKYWCSGEPYGIIRINYKKISSSTLVVSKFNSDSLIDNILLNKDIINEAILTYFKNNKFHTIDLMNYL